ncbi:MAG: hypothetical protein IJU16_08625, partial [Clostridia bacterium]|nr:hypothetical protein [Clostridia bacterium]
MAHTVFMPCEQVRLFGRVDVRADALAFDWTNSGLAFRFRGTGAVLSFDTPALAQRLYVQLTVDGVNRRVLITGSD